MESVLVYDGQGNEATHFIKQPDGSLQESDQPGQSPQLPFVTELLNENNPDSLPKRGIAQDPADQRYYYYTAIPVILADQVTGAVVVGTSLNTLLPEQKQTALADVILYGEDSRALASTVGMQDQKGLFERTISISEDLYLSVLGRKEVVPGENITVDDRSYKIAYAPLEVGEDQLGVFAVLLPQNFVVSLRCVINGIFYVLVTGCQWRALPTNFPTWKTVYHYFWQWRRDKTWQRLHDTLRAWVRQKAGRHKHPTAGCVVSQSVKTTAIGGTDRGYDAGKQVKGRKRHVLVDTLGLLLVVVVTSAGVQDRDGAKLLFQRLTGSCKKLVASG